jgi:hypothetical protein
MASNYRKKINLGEYIINNISDLMMSDKKSGNRIKRNNGKKHSLSGPRLIKKNRRIYDR